MRTARWIAPLLWLAPCVVQGCATQVQGQLMLAIQTDMALPKDIDRIRITVANVRTGAFAFQKDFEKIGEDGSIRLPATLGIIAPKDPSDAVKIRVIASRSADTSVRVLREVVTTVPTDRSAMLPIKIEFLCDGTGKAALDDKGQVKRDADGIVEVESTCPGGLTCVAGSCVKPEVPSTTLLDFDASEIFGGGTGTVTGDGACFDTTGCFETATNLAPPKKTTAGLCVAKASGEFNVGLRTQGGGICGAAGCFVALDAESDAGWKPGPDGTITLPTAVCDKVEQGEISAVVTAPIGRSTCQKKRLSLPTCGPWSATGHGSFTQADPKKPTLVAPGQSGPVSIAAALGSIYWTCQGTFDAMGVPTHGAVKAVSVNGGQPLSIRGTAEEPIPRGIAVDSGRQFVFWTNAGDGRIRWAPLLDATGATTAHDLLQATGQVEGIAVSSGKVSWTNLLDNTVQQVNTTVAGSDLTSDAPKLLSDQAPTTLLPPHPRGIAAIKDSICWTYEDTRGSGKGAVACSLAGTPTILAPDEQTPRAIAMSAPGSGSTDIKVYWADFGDLKAGEVAGIFMVPLKNGVPGAKVQIAQEDYPAGLAVDGQTLYWTSRTGGRLMRLKEGASTPEVLASGQQNPGALAVDATNVYWINEGSATAAGGVPNGAIMKIAK